MLNPPVIFQYQIGMLAYEASPLCNKTLTINEKWPRHNGCFQPKKVPKQVKARMGLADPASLH